MGSITDILQNKPFPFFSLLSAAFIAVLYIQSGFDKITDRKGNLEWLTGHFSKSPFKNTVAPMLLMVTILELAAAAAGVGGILQIIIKESTRLVFYTGIISCVNLICLFTGQRFAKDYAGAAGLVPYFILSLLTMLFGAAGI